MVFTKEYKCRYCNNVTGVSKGEKNYSLVIPEDIVPRDAFEQVYANSYKYEHHHFCNWKCYNLKVLDNAINALSKTLVFPEENFLPLHMERDIDKAKCTLNKLVAFKETLIEK
ncbi:hypothetical protein ACTXGU_00240 [Niallia sp. 01092]|uniref:hypothetical protein n=1 Tax=Niallia sp. 01092 TaxID=3457759 RepID=UPI003FD30DDC